MKLMNSVHAGVARARWSEFCVANGEFAEAGRGRCCWWSHGPTGDAGDGSAGC